MRERHYQHRYKEKHSLRNLKDASRGDQPFSAILSEDTWNLDGREALSGLSSRAREVSKISWYRRHFKLS
jgi:hypothetical protein